MKTSLERNVMETIPVSPVVAIDKNEQESFRKRVIEVIAKVETDVGSAHLFEPMSDVIRRQHIFEKIRTEIAEALFTEYNILRKHVSERDEIVGELELLGFDTGKTEDGKNNSEEGFEELFFESIETLLKSFYEEAV